MSRCAQQWLCLVCSIRFFGPCNCGWCRARVSLCCIERDFVTNRLLLYWHDFGHRSSVIAEHISGLIRAVFMLQMSSCLLTVMQLAFKFGENLVEFWNSMSIDVVTLCLGRGALIV
jgi:hypothetical protein